MCYQTTIFAATFLFLLLYSEGLMPASKSDTAGLLVRNLKNDISPLKKYFLGKTDFCVATGCKLVCLNGKAISIEQDVKAVLSPNCSVIDELRLYNYKFPDRIIYTKFLGNLSISIKNLHIVSSKVIILEQRAFQNALLENIHLESLQLKELHSGLLEGMSTDFKELSIIQRDTPIEYVGDNFLNHVKYQIRSIQLEIGMQFVENLTGGSCLLNNLRRVDLSFNNFSGRLHESSFSKLSMVEHLDLSNSRITSLPENIFANNIATLRYLDLSFNLLHRVTHSIFGWLGAYINPQVMFTGNRWQCSCDLHTKMSLFVSIPNEVILCAEPEQYRNYSVLDARVCNTSSIISEMPIVNNTTPLSTLVVSTMEQSSEGATEVGEHSFKPNNVSIGNLGCFNREDSMRTITRRPIKWPTVNFAISVETNLRVVVNINSKLMDVYVLVWFSKVTKQYYKMEINYREYGLGCYSDITNEYVTTVENLYPNVSYTFCLVLRGQIKTSPFNCKSIYVDGNSEEAHHNAWITKNMRATGITLIVIGILMFASVGILMVFLVLTQRPTLLKGSKRVTSLKNNSKSILVFPKNRREEDFKLKEKQLVTKKHSRSNIPRNRLVSTESIASTQSYILPNFYEDVAFRVKLSSADVIIPTHSDTYLPTHNCKHEDSLINYAEIPFHVKRMSNDPLPEIP